MTSVLKGAGRLTRMTPRPSWAGYACEFLPFVHALRWRHSLPCCHGIGGVMCKISKRVQVPFLLGRQASCTNNQVADSCISLLTSLSPMSNRALHVAKWAALRARQTRCLTWILSPSRNSEGTPGVPVPRVMSQRSTSGSLCKGDPSPEYGKGQMGPALMGSLRILVFLTKGLF